MATPKKKTAEDEAAQTGKKVIALHEIVRCLRPGENGDPKNNIAPKKPKVQTLSAGTIFMANDTEDDDGDSEYSTLLAAGAIRDYTKKDEQDVKRMTSVVGNIEQEEAVASASSDSVKTGANVGTTTTGGRADGTNLI